MSHNFCHRGRGEGGKGGKTASAESLQIKTQTVQKVKQCMLVWSSLGCSQTTRTEEEAQAIFDDGRNFLHLYCALAKLSIRLSTDSSCCPRWNMCIIYIIYIIYKLQRRMYNPTIPHGPHGLLHQELFAGMDYAPKVPWILAPILSQIHIR